MNEKKVHLSTDKVLTGTVGGLAEYFDVDKTIARIGVVVVSLITAVVPMLIVYLVAYLLIKNQQNEVG